MQNLTNSWIEAPNTAAELHVRWNDVMSIPTVYLRNADDSRLVRINVPTDDGLKSTDNLSRCDDGIDTALRRSAMSSLSLNPDIKTIE